AGNLVYTSGQLPTRAGTLAQTGKVGLAVTSEEAKELARISTLYALAAIDALVGIDSVIQVVKVVGFVASAAGFNGQPGVINGASDLLAEVFGGSHARSAVGVSELPLDSPVEVELVVEVE
ncbi:MAG: RidA family protein, partial [Mycobacterium sp.]